MDLFQKSSKSNFTYDQKMNRETIITYLEQFLKVKFPASYREFLLNGGQEKINELPIYGLPSKLPETTSTRELLSFFKKLPLIFATELLRIKRTDLPKSLVVIRLVDVRALCLNLESGTKEDCPLTEVNLKEKILPVQVHSSFKAYIKEGKRTKERIKIALRQIAHRRRETEEKREFRFSHIEQKKYPRPKDWRIFRSCVQDKVVGLAAFRFSPRINGLLIDVFIATGHPNYEKGHGVRNLALLVLSDAYRSGGSMRLTFTRNANFGKVPDELVDLANQYNISFQHADKGIVSHNEAVNLYSVLIGASPETKRAINELKGAGFTLEGFCYLVSSNIWTKEEATWLLLNHHRPEGILLGKDVPEDRIFYLESLSYGRPVLAVKRLCRKILTEKGITSLEEEENTYCVPEPREEFFILKNCPEFSLPKEWVISNSEISISSEQSVVVLSRPRQFFFNGEKELEADLKKLRRTKGDIKILLTSDEISKEVKNINNIKEILEKFERKGVYLLLAPFTCRELDDEVDKKMAQARIMRK